ncbi:hypothetical protein KY337_01335 [Candidatus Woesearchaeota archaeon]|nr:hypothetical protein [Candidatus Woesearchaeota archaeon]
MKKIILLGLVLVLIFLVSCTGTSKQVISEIDIHKGTTGLRMDIIEGMPPKEMFVGSEKSPVGFQIGVELENQGAFDIVGGVLSISYDRKFNEFVDPGSNPMIPFDLRGKSQLTPQGDLTRTIARGRNKGLPPGSQSVYVVSACYKYETLATVDVCISPYFQPLVNVGKDVCLPKDFSNIKLSGGQGAPVTISKVQESIRPTEYDLVDIVFAITLDNLGGGEIRSELNYDKECRGSEVLDIKDVRTAKIKEISFSEYSLSNGRIKCNPEELRVGEKTIICTATIDKRLIKAPYITPLTIKVGYGYVQRLYPTIKFKELADV